jgi:hypothetical protein
MGLVPDFLCFARFRSKTFGSRSRFAADEVVSEGTKCGSLIAASTLRTPLASLSPSRLAHSLDGAYGSFHIAFRFEAPLANQGQQDSSEEGQHEPS